MQHNDASSGSSRVPLALIVWEVEFLYLHFGVPSRILLWFSRVDNFLFVSRERNGAKGGGVFLSGVSEFLVFCLSESQKNALKGRASSCFQRGVCLCLREAGCLVAAEHLQSDTWWIKKPFTSRVIKQSLFKSNYCNRLLFNPFIVYEVARSWWPAHRTW